ncbi:FAD-dependent monooxygenase [Streptomyces bugieae]|uniref:FAD-dependent monooxygenase n=1 Tax=Streptomyces bugieae TaxID=3098223 RepID=A0ABU7NQ26_9ACTN|nr:FAD-dependent monooxygenase [Streptomyces sp. DSM 41528]
MNASSSTPGTGLQFTHPYLAVVLGGGFTGMLAAAALSEYAEVIVVERERLPRTPALPTDLPHARHAHLLTSDGARMVEALVPGGVERWLAEGARRVPVPAELAGRASLGRLDRRCPPHLIACSRDLLDRVIRRQVPTRPGVAVIDGTEAEELTGTAEHVTGVRVRDTTTGETYRLDADLVVDATGRHSTSRARLAALGLPRVGEDRADSAIVSATRIFRAPEGAENLPVLTSRSGLTVPPPGPSGAARAAAGRTLPVRAVPERTATLVPIEGGRWLVTLTGTGEDRPTQHAGRFVPFARRAGDPRIGDLIAGAEPLSEVRLSRDTVNRRRRFEQLPSWPSGFLALGGAVAALSPDFGQGLSLAAHGATALREALARYGMDDPALARRVQRTIGRLVDELWSVAIGVPGHSPAAGRTTVCRAYVDAVTGGPRPAPFLRGPAALAMLRDAARTRPVTGTADWEASPLPVPPAAQPTASGAPPEASPTAAAAPSAVSAVPTARRPLGFRPTALRRIGGAGRRKPAEG